MRYIVRIDPKCILTLKEKFKIVWESKVLKDLIFIESELSEDEISKEDGVLICRQEAEGRLY
jgi:hypothetical protein